MFGREVGQAWDAVVVILRCHFWGFSVTTGKEVGVWSRWRVCSLIKEFCSKDLNSKDLNNVW